MAKTTNAAQFLDQKAVNAVREHARVRLNLECAITHKAKLLQRIASVADAAVFTDPDFLVRACRDIKRLADEISIIADQIELIHRNPS